MLKYEQYNSNNLNYFNSCQRTTIGMTLLLGCLLIFLIRQVHSSQIHSGHIISRRPSTYRWILYSHLNSTPSSTLRNTRQYGFSSGPGESSHIRKDAEEPAQIGDFTQLTLGRGVIVTLFHHINIYLAWLVVCFIT
jgi:hypothetical protein